MFASIERTIKIWIKGYLFWPLKSQDPKRMPYGEGLVDSWARECSSPHTRTSSLTDPLPLQEHSSGLMPQTRPRSIPGLRHVNKLQWKCGHRSLSAYGNPTLPLFLFLITYPKQKGKHNKHTQRLYPQFLPPEENDSLVSLCTSLIFSQVPLWNQPSTSSTVSDPGFNQGWKSQETTLSSLDDE